MKAQNVTSMVLASVLLAGCSKAVLAEPGPGEQPPSVGALLGYIADQHEYSIFNQILFASENYVVLRQRLQAEPLTFLPVNNAYFSTLSRSELNLLRTDEQAAYAFISRHVLIGEWTAEAIARAEFLPSLYDEDHQQAASVPGGVGNDWELGLSSGISDIQRADEGWIIGVDWPIFLGNKPGTWRILPGQTRTLMQNPAAPKCTLVRITNLSTRPVTLKGTKADGTVSTVEVPGRTVDGNFGFADAVTIEVTNPHSVAVTVITVVIPC